MRHTKQEQLISIMKDEKQKNYGNFLDFLSCYSVITGVSIAKKVGQLGLDIRKIRDQAYDGAGCVDKWCGCFDAVIPKRCIQSWIERAYREGMQSCCYNSGECLFISS